MQNIIATLLLAIALILFWAWRIHKISNDTLNALAAILTIIAGIAAIVLFVVPGASQPPFSPITSTPEIESTEPPLTNTPLQNSTPSQSPTKTPTPPPTLTSISQSPTKTPTPLPTLTSIISEKDGMILLYVPDGEFMMGSSNSGNADELPAHQVYLDAFWIDQTEVTNAMYANCVKADKCNPPGKIDHFSNLSYANHPVVYVDWNMANAYCSWAGRRLPTEAEWEKAARDTDGRIYPWGNSIPNRDLANYTGTVGDTTEVGKYLNGASPFGALDMAGNVWEWVNDWFDVSYYQLLVFQNPTGPSSGMDRVLRGGSWYQLDGDLRSANRHWDNPMLPDNADVGFRCAISP